MVLAIYKKTPFYVASKYLRHIGMHSVSTAIRQGQRMLKRLALCKSMSDALRSGVEFD